MLLEAYQDDQFLFRETDRPEIAPAAIDAVEDAARHRADTVLGELMNPLAPKKQHNTVTRDAFIKKTNAAWAPDTPETAELAAKGALFSISEVYQFAPADKKAASIKKRYIATVRAANAALDSMQILHRGYEGNPTKGSFPDAKTILANPSALSEMAKFIVNRKSLDNYKWEENDAEQLEIIADYLKHASPAALERIHRSVFEGKRAEHNFWVKQAKSAAQNVMVKGWLEDPSANLPLVKRRMSTDDTNDAKLLAISDELAAQRLSQQRRSQEGSYHDKIPQDVKEMAEAIHDDTSNDSVRIRNLEDGSGVSPYAARLSVLGVKGAGKAVPTVRQERFRGSRPQVRGSLQRLTADTPTQSYEAKSTKPEHSELINRTPEERLVASDGLRQLGAVLPHEELKDQ